MTVINLSKFLKELNQSKLTREEELQQIFKFILENFNHDQEKNWKKLENRALMFTALAEYEWKRTKKAAFEEIIRERGKDILINRQ